MKTCTVCKIPKLEGEFYTQKKKGKSYLKSECKVCSSLAVVRYQKANPDKVRERHWKRTLGVGYETYDKMFESQSGVCKICQQLSSKCLRIDHCHTTNMIRGLLCDPCNMALGLFKDDITRLENAIKYLEGDRNGWI